MKLKKLIGGMLCAVMVAGMLAGCGGGNGNETNGDVETITIWTGGSSSFDVCSKLIEEWNNTTGKEKGVKIDYQLKAGETLSQSLEIALKAGNAPDMFFGGSMKSFAENGYIGAIDDLTNGDKILARYEGLIDPEDHMVNGKTYTVPSSTNLRGIVYNKDLFKKAGIVDENGEAKPPVTFDDYREYAKILTNEDAGEYGAIFPMKWSGWFGSDVATLSQNCIGHTGYDPTTGKYDYSAYAKIMQYILDIYKDGSAYPDVEGLDNDTARALFAEGKIGMKIAYSFDVGVLNYQFPAKCDWGVAPMPVFDANDCYYQRTTYGTTPFINKKSVDNKKEAVTAAFEFLISDEYAMDLYKNGCEFPVSYEMIQNTELGEEAPKGWREFADMLKVSHTPNHEPKTETANLVPIADRFTEYVWSEKKTPEQVVEEFVKDLYAAKDEYYKNNPNETPDIYVNKDWNIKR